MPWGRRFWCLWLFCVCAAAQRTANLSPVADGFYAPGASDGTSPVLQFSTLTDVILEYSNATVAPLRSADGWGSVASAVLTLTGCTGHPHAMALDVYWEKDATPLNEISTTYDTRPQNVSNYVYVTTVSLPVTTLVTSITIDVSVPIRFLTQRTGSGRMTLHLLTRTNWTGSETFTCNSRNAVVTPSSGNISVNVNGNSPAIVNNCGDCLLFCTATYRMCVWCPLIGKCVEGTAALGPFWTTNLTAACPIWMASSDCLAVNTYEQYIPSTRSLALIEGVDSTINASSTPSLYSQLGTNQFMPPRRASSLIWFDGAPISNGAWCIKFNYHVLTTNFLLGGNAQRPNVYLLANPNQPMNLTWNDRNSLGERMGYVDGSTGGLGDDRSHYWDFSSVLRYGKPPYALYLEDTSLPNAVAFNYPSSNSPIPDVRAQIYAGPDVGNYAFGYPLFARAPNPSYLLTCEDCMMQCPVNLGGCFWDTATRTCQEAYPAAPVTTSCPNYMTITPDWSTSLSDSVLLPFSNTGLTWTHFDFYHFNLSSLQGLEIADAIFRVYRGTSFVLFGYRVMFWFQPPSNVSTMDVATFLSSDMFPVNPSNTGLGSYQPFQSSVDYAIKNTLQRNQTGLWLAVVATCVNDNYFTPAYADVLPRTIPRLHVTFGFPKYPNLTLAGYDTCTQCFERGNDMVPSRNFGFCWENNRCVEGSGPGPYYESCASHLWMFGGCSAGNARGSPQGQVASIFPLQSTITHNGVNRDYSRDPYYVIYDYSFLNILPGPVTTIYLQFDTSYITEAGLNFGSVHLQLFAFPKTGIYYANTLRMDVYEISNNTWDATRIDYNHDPPFFRRFIDTVDDNDNNTLSCNDDYCTIDINVTPSLMEAVQRGGLPRVSFILQSRHAVDMTVAIIAPNHPLMPQFGPRLLFTNSDATSDVLNSACPSMPNCSACLAAAGDFCGWCESTQQCLVGGSRAPLALECPGVGAWFYDACPANRFKSPAVPLTFVATPFTSTTFQNNTNSVIALGQGVVGNEYQPESGVEAIKSDVPIFAAFGVNFTGAPRTAIRGLSSVVPISCGFSQVYDIFGPVVMGNQFTMNGTRFQGFNNRLAAGAFPLQHNLVRNQYQLDYYFDVSIATPFDDSTGFYYYNVPKLYITAAKSPFSRYQPRVLITADDLSDANPNCAAQTDPCTCLVQPNCAWCQESSTCLGAYDPTCTFSRFLEVCPASGPQGQYGMQAVGFPYYPCSCEPCPAGWRFDNSSTPPCVRCDGGEISAAGDPVCTICASGTEATINGTQCIDCQLGRARNANLSMEVHETCHTCDPGYYAPELQSPTCLACPKDTYQDTAGAGACIPCVTGQDCLAAATANRSLLAGYGGCCAPGGIAKCGLLEACPGGICPLTCPGTICKIGYEGDFCERCDKSGDIPYHRVGQVCVECPRVAYLLIVLAVVLVVLLCVFLLKYGKAISHHLTSVSIGLGYMQAVGLFSLFEFSLPPFVRNMIDYLSVTNLSSNLINTECAFPRLSFLAGFVMRLALPVVVLIVFLIMYFTVKLHAIIVKRTVASFRTNHQRFVRDRETGLSGLARVKESVRWQAVRFTTKYKSSLELSKLKSKIMNAYITFLVLAYLFTSQTALEIFACVPNDTGALYLASDTSTPCSGAQYDDLRIVAIVALAVYTAGLPVIFSVILAANRVEAQLGDEKFISRYGMLFSRYKAGRFYWEIVIMLRKFAVVACAVFSRVLQPSYGTALILIFVFAGNIGLHMWGKPYRYVQHNVLELALMVVFVLGLIAACSASSGGDAFILGVFLVIFFAIGLGFVFFILMFDLVSALRRALAGGKAGATLARLCGGDNVDDNADKNLDSGWASDFDSVSNNRPNARPGNSVEMTAGNASATGSFRASAGGAPPVANPVFASE